WLVFPAPPRNSPDFLAYLVVDQLLFGGRREVTDSAYFARSLGTSLGHRLVAALDARNLDDGVYYATDPGPLLHRSPTFLQASFEVGRQAPVDSMAAIIARALETSIREDLTSA